MSFLDKVARIRASFTAEFPEALFVAPEEPAAPVSAETGGDVEMQEEVEGAGIRGLELEGVPRSIKEAFKGGKADGNAERKQQPHDSPHAADETASAMRTVSFSPGPSTQAYIRAGHVGVASARERS